MKYIMIMEDGRIYKTDVITMSDKESANNGILDIIDTETMKSYYQDQWYDLELWG